MALVTQAEVEARLGRSLTTSEASSFTGVLGAIEAMVKALLDTGIENDSESTRYYDGGIMNIPISPCTDISSVKLVDYNYDDVETLLPEDYTLEPINKTLKTMVRYRYGKITKGFNKISVTAKFTIYNDADTLAIVKDTILEAVVSEISSDEGIKSESIEGYSITYMDSATKDILKSIKFLFPGIL